MNAELGEETGRNRVDMRYEKSNPVTIFRVNGLIELLWELITFSLFSNKLKIIQNGENAIERRFIEYNRPYFSW